MPKAKIEVYSTYITLRNGRRLYAKNYGLKAFRFEVDVEKKVELSPDEENSE